MQHSFLAGSCSTVIRTFTHHRTKKRELCYGFTMSNSIDIRRGYQTAILGRVTTMHAEFYSAHYGFGRAFEIKVGAEMAEFLSRIPNASNEVWAAVKNGQIVGSVSVDGEDIGGGIAHLRWFVMDNAARGSGIGRQMLREALQFADDHGFRETHLWTFKSLDAARKLYEREGFRLVHEEAGTQWGSEVLEQKFVRARPH